MASLMEAKRVGMWLQLVTLLAIWTQGDCRMRDGGGPGRCRRSAGDQRRARGRGEGAAGGGDTVAGEAGLREVCDDNYK